jgi:uncharacterized protein with NRDE domain
MLNMCTLTLLRRLNYTVITMNRDEARDRHEGDLVGIDADSHYLYPSDGRAGGSWFGCNHHGVVLGLLNRYQDAQQPDKESRGYIIRDAVQQGSIAQVVSFVTGLELDRFNPFELVIADHLRAWHMSWSGSSLTKALIKGDTFVISSSGRHPIESVEHRRERFESWLAGEVAHADGAATARSVLEDFHLEQYALYPQHAVLMDRSDAHTKSVCQVTLNRNQLAFRYFCEADLSRIRADGHNALADLNPQQHCFQIQHEVNTHA